MVTRSRECVLLAMSSTHTTTHNHVKSVQLAIALCNHNQSDILGIDINRVVTWYSNTNLELSRQIGVTINGLLIVRNNHAVTRLLVNGFLDLVHVNILLPILQCRGFFAVQPQFSKRTRLRGQNLCNVLGVLTHIGIRRVLERSRCGDDISVNITASTLCATSRVHNGRQDGFHIPLEHTVHLPRTTGCRAQRVVAVLVRQIVEHLVHVRRKLARGHLQAKHELVVFRLARYTLLAVVLLVRPVELHDLDGVLRDMCLFVGEFLAEWESEVV
mmetsp:Transcript_14506/g.25025  ORF Transcript_14506/g.25025 Transcript_14506/m.25025 type:complete len:272 (-) Transcript_14506:288-1103(-)